MVERIGNYTEVEAEELWDAWSNQLAIQQPELAETLVRKMIESAEGEQDGTN